MQALTADAVQDECDRQMVLLALGHLAVERPGWDDALGRIAEKLHGRPMFEQFRDLHRSSAAGVPAPSAGGRDNED